MASDNTAVDERILVLTPSANDGPATARVLRGAGFLCVVARTIEELCELISAGAGAAVVAEEALSPPAADRVGRLLANQEAWSDLPIIVFTARTPEERSAGITLAALSGLGNVTILNRPVELVTIISSARAALRARRRQYTARQLLAKLREADRRKTEFLGFLSHELRNPLVPIRNGIYLLGRVPPDSEQAQRAKQVIERQVDHLSHIVDDLLDINRISRGSIELDRQRIDACEVVQRACEDHRSVLSEQGIQVCSRFSGPIWIDADETRLAQIISNLLHNAAKWSREGSSVWVSVENQAGSAEIRVRDEGVGISGDLLPKLFLPFVQSRQALSGKQAGLGLGLSLVKGLVELHGGTVQALSEGPQRGAEFVVRLPLADQYAPSASLPGGALKNGTRERSRRSLQVLLIEDNVDAAESLAEVLEQEGHRVYVSTDGASGLAKARELTPNVVLCDIGLPDLSGYEVAQRLRSAAGDRRQRLIALSGYAQPEDRERASRRDSMLTWRSHRRSTRCSSCSAPSRVNRLGPRASFQPLALKLRDKHGETFGVDLHLTGAESAGRTNESGKS